MADIHKCTMFFQTRDAGFSETVYREAEGTARALDALEKLAKLRVDISGHGVRCTALRASVEQKTRVMRLRPVNIVSGRPTTNPADTSFQSLLLRVESTQAQRRSYMLRALPDTSVIEGMYQNVDLSNRVLNRFFAELTSGQWLMKCQSNALAPRQLVSISNAGLVTTLVPHGLVEGDTMYFYKTRNAATGLLLKGDRRVLAGTTTYTFTTDPLVVGSGVNPGFIRKRFIIYPAINFVEFVRVSSRKVGRPFGQPVGRRLRRA